MMAGFDDAVVAQVREHPAEQALAGKWYDSGGRAYNVHDPRFGAFGDGATDDRPALAGADALGPAEGSPGKTYRIASDLTLTNGWRPNKSILKPASGVTVTISGPVEAGPYQWIDKSLGGTVNFGGDHDGRYLPQWWGGKPDFTVDSRTAIQAAIDCAKASGISATTIRDNVVHLSAGGWKSSGKLVLPRTGTSAERAVQLRGDGDRLTWLYGIAGSFVSGDAVIEWEATASQALHQAITDIAVVAPAVAGTRAIRYTPTDKSTGAAIIAERLQIDLRIFAAGNNTYNPGLVKLEGELSMCTVDLHGDCTLGTLRTYDTILLETDTDDFGSPGADASGFEASRILRLMGGELLGGRISVFQGRLNGSVLLGGDFGDGVADGPSWHFKNCAQSVIGPIAGEGRGDKPQIKLEGCYWCEFGHMGLGIPNDYDGTGVGNGLEIVDCHNVTINGRMAMAGQPSYSASGVKAVVMDALSTNVQLRNFSLNDTAANEVTWNAPDGSGCVMECFIATSGTWAVLGRSAKNPAVYGGVGPHQLAGPLQFAPVGTGAADGATALDIENVALTGTTQYGAQINPTGTTAATARVVGASIRPAAAAGLATAQMMTLLVQNPLLGAGASAATKWGAYIAAITGGTTNIAIETEGGRVIFGGLAAYANNAAAVAAGLTAGCLYTVTGTDPRQVAVVV